jgi:hypothetical protein
LAEVKLLRRDQVALAKLGRFDKVRLLRQNHGRSARYFIGDNTKAATRLAL